MTATLLDILMILSLGILGGTGTGLFIGFIARKQERDWAAMQKKEILTNILLIVVCSATISAVLAWYLYVYSGT
jgi:small-conductance mechanosensitive channel